MISIKFSRRSVCMGDDINAGEYILNFNNNANLKDLMEKITNVNIKRSLAFTGSSTNWIIKSNIGDLAKITVDEKYKWVIEYINHNPLDKLSDLKIEYIRGE